MYPTYTLALPDREYVFSTKLVSTPPVQGESKSNAGLPAIHTMTNEANLTESEEDGAPSIVCLKSYSKAMGCVCQYCMACSAYLPNV